jgi:hypothetical protein
MSEHLKNQRGSNPHTFFLSIFETHRIRAFSIAKMAQFNKGMGEDMRCLVYWGSMLDNERTKTNYNFHLKILDHCIFASEIQRSFVRP